MKEIAVILAEPILRFVKRHWLAILIVWIVLWTVEAALVAVLGNRIIQWIAKNFRLSFFLTVITAFFFPFAYPFALALWTLSKMSVMRGLSLGDVSSQESDSGYNKPIDIDRYNPKL